MFSVSVLHETFTVLRPKHRIISTYIALRKYERCLTDTILNYEISNLLNFSSLKYEIIKYLKRAPYCSSREVKCIETKVAEE